jgi:hypothetical protein
MKNRTGEICYNISRSLWHLLGLALRPPIQLHPGRAISYASTGTKPVVGTTPRKTQAASEILFSSLSSST